MNLNFLLNRCEFAEPKKYNGRNELIFAIFACLAWFIAVILRLNFEGYDGWTTLDKAIEASSTVVFCGPVFFLATPLGSKVTRNLLKRDGIKFQILACTLLLAYISLVKFLELSPDKFVWLEQMSNLVLKDKFWINTALFIAGVFVVLRIPFLMLRLREVTSEIRRHEDLITVFRQNLELSILLIFNFVYMVLSHTSLSSNSPNSFEGYYIGIGYFIIFFLMNLPVFKKTSASKLMAFDLFLIIACLGVLFWFSIPFFSFGTFIGVNLFVVVVVYGLGLGREHFGYSFQIRKQDVNYFISTLPLIVLTLVPLGLAFKFVEPSSLLGSGSEILKLATYSILFSFRVGIFEEVFVRSGLMVLLRDQLSERTLKKRNDQQLIFCSAVGCSVVFGLSHINNPATGSSLTPLEYKSVYILLAFLASLFYSFAFGETNRLWCSITIHGFVDTVAVVLLGGFLTVPF